MPSKQTEAIVRYNLADLHTHSICSDGMRTPTEAVQEAHDAGPVSYTHLTQPTILLV